VFQSANLVFLSIICTVIALSIGLLGLQYSYALDIQLSLTLRNILVRLSMLLNNVHAHTQRVFQGNVVERIGRILFPQDYKDIDYDGVRPPGLVNNSVFCYMVRCISLFCIDIAEFYIAGICVAFANI
jgi:hypothetical protein